MPHQDSEHVRIDRVADEETLSDCLAIRHAVFVEEQGVPVELEIDEHDHSSAIHFAVYLDAGLVGTARLCLFNGVAKIQRVAVSKEARGSGLGAKLVDHLVRYARTAKLAPKIALDAQAHATGFYERLGFKTVGTPFDDAGIPHIRMEQEA